MHSVKEQQVRLRPGMVLEGNSHSVVIPRYDHEAVQGLNEEFLNQHDNIASDKEVADSVTDYINQTIEYGNPAEALNFNPYTGEPIDDTLSLESSFLTEKGRCKEQAAVAYILMKLNGVDSAYVKGGYPKWDDGEEEYIHGKHAWLKVDTDQGKFFADPTNGHFEPYDEFTEHYRGIGIFEIEQEVRVKDGDEDGVGRFL